MHITDYSPRDFDDLCALYANWDEERHEVDRDLLARSIAQQQEHCYGRILLAREDCGTESAHDTRGQLVGYTQIGKCYLVGFEPFYEIMQLLVTEDHRSRGIGKALVGRVVETARAEGISAIRLSSQVQRSRAHVFYERLGFTFYKVSKFYQMTV